MPKDTRSFRLDLDFSLGYSLFRTEASRRLAAALPEVLPMWSDGVHEQLGAKPGPLLDISNSIAIQERLRELGMSRGPVARKLAEYLGPAPSPRMLGSLELRGSDRSMILVLVFDEQVVKRSGEDWLWGNSLSLQVCQRSVEGQDAVSWATLAFQSLCRALSPAHAVCHIPEEFKHKNFSDEPRTVRAVGLDISRALPGIYWANYLGEPYLSFLGRKNLSAVPARTVFEEEQGVGFFVGSDPRGWEDPAYKEVELKVLQHLGEEHFFRKGAPNRTTLAPSLDLFQRLPAP